VGDEAESWLIVRDSSNIAELFHNNRYTGHPMGYYLALFAVDTVVPTWLSVQILQFGTACAVVSLLLWASPFTLGERLLLPFGTYTLFEYGIKSRSYALGFAVLCLACQVLGGRRRSPLLFGLCIAALANVHVLFGVMGGAMAVAFLPEQIAALRAAPASERRSLALRLAGAALLVAAAMAFAVFSAIPPEDSSIGRTMVHREPLLRTVGVLLPLTGMIGSDTPLNDLRFLPVALVLLGIMLWQLRLNRPIFAYVLVTTVALLLFFLRVYAAAPHHFGLFFCLVISAVWLARTRPAPGQPTRPLGPLILVPILCVQMFFGMRLLDREFRQPYSNSFATAEFIRQNGWREQPIAALADYRAMPVLAYLDLPSIYYIPGHRWGSFLIWNWERLGARADVNGDMHELAQGDLGIPCPFTLLTAWTLPPDNLGAFGLREAGRFDGAATDENYVVYRHDCP
jgi:hypothetical protein